MSFLTTKLVVTLSAIALAAGLGAGCSRFMEDEHARAATEPRSASRVARAEPAPNVMRSAPRVRRDAEPEDRSPMIERVPRGLPMAPQATVPAMPPSPPVEPRQPIAPAAVQARPPAVTPVPDAQPVVPVQPRIINPSAPGAPPAEVAPPAAPPADPLPVQPGPPPPRPDSVPAPPNRVNITPPRQSGGGIASARPDTSPETDRPAAQDSRRTALATPQTAPANRIEEARRLLIRGKILEARSLFEAAARTSPALALLELGRTYDPYYLGMLEGIDAGSEPRRAALLYQEAIRHGSPTAGSDLDRLRGTVPGLR